MCLWWFCLNKLVKTCGLLTLRAGTHWWQSRIRRGTQSTICPLLDFAVDKTESGQGWLRLCCAFVESRLSPTRSTLRPEPHDLVPSDVVWSLSPVSCQQSGIWQLVTVDVVARVERVQLGRLCRKWVIYVARMSPESYVEHPFDILLLICDTIHNRMTSRESNEIPYCTLVSHGCIHAPLVRPQAKPKVVRSYRQHGNVTEYSNPRFASCIIRIVEKHSLCR